MWQWLKYPIAEILIIIFVSGWLVLGFYLPMIAFAPNEVEDTITQTYHSIVEEWQQ